MIGPALAGAAAAGGGAALAAGHTRWVSRWRQDAARRVAASARLAADLAVLGSDAEEFVPGAAARAAAHAAAGLLVTVVLWPMLGSVGLMAIPAAIGVALLGARWSLARQAETARAEFRAAALELAELVSLAIGGGLGVPAALERASAALTGDAGSRLRALTGGGPEPWATLEAFGDRVRVGELSDFARTLSVGVHHQARTREVLLGWAQAARSARLEDAEAHAAATTEAMTGPLALVAFGFLAVIGVPAVLELLSGARVVHL